VQQCSLGVSLTKEAGQESPGKQYHVKTNVTLSSTKSSNLFSPASFLAMSMIKCRKVGMSHFEVF
jgi:hypothetical protein